MEAYWALVAWMVAQRGNSSIGAEAGSADARPTATYGCAVKETKLHEVSSGSACAKCERSPCMEATMSAADGRTRWSNTVRNLCHRAGTKSSPAHKRGRRIDKYSRRVASDSTTDSGTF